MGRPRSAALEVLVIGLDWTGLDWIGLNLPLGTLNLRINFDMGEIYFIW